MATNNLVSKDEPSNYLYLEGSDDVHVFGSLLNCYEIIGNDYRTSHRFKKRDEHFEIQEKGGLERLLQIVELELKRDIPMRRIGIVIDADEDTTINRWEKVRNILLRSNYDKSSIPRLSVKGGIVIRQEGRPTVGVWIMPDNGSAGRIEDFVSFLRQPDDVLWPMAADIVRQVMEKDCRFPVVQESKARLHTWLAWQKQPGKSMGQAITSRYVEHTAFHAQELIAWFCEVFELPREENQGISISESNNWQKS